MYHFVQENANGQLQAAIDGNNYEESDLIIIKISVPLPYQANWTSYEKFTGDIEFSGKKYKYVERKLANDTLYLKCVQNTKEMMLQAAKNNFLTTSDLNKNTAEKVTINACDFKPVINQSTLAFQTSPPLKSNGIAGSKDAGQRLRSADHNSPEQPPDLMFI